MHFVLTLHSHLPYVLNHGRWPHGSDWLCEATLDTYLPLLEALLELKEERYDIPRNPWDHSCSGQPVGQPAVSGGDGCFLPTATESL